MLENILNIAQDFPLITLSTVMPLLVSIYVWRTRSSIDKPLTVVLWFCVFFFLSDLPLWVTSGLGIRNLRYNYIRDISFHLMIIGIYYFVLNNSFKKRVILYMILILSIIGITPLLLSYEAPSQLTAIHKLAIVGVVFLHFHTLISELKITKILNYPFFWISSGILTFACGSALIMLFYTYTFSVKTPSMFLFYEQFLSLLIILMFVFIGIGFFNSNKKYA